MWKMMSAKGKWLILNNIPRESASVQSFEIDSEELQMISCEVTKRLSLDEKRTTKRLFHHDDKVSVPQRKGASSRDANGTDTLPIHFVASLWLSIVMGYR
jgi:hypothetical protein